MDKQLWLKYEFYIDILEIQFTVLITFKNKNVKNKFDFFFLNVHSGVLRAYVYYVIFSVVFSTITG